MIQKKTEQWGPELLILVPENLIILPKMDGVGKG